MNVLVGGDFTTVADLAAMGVRRISVGGALARTAWTGFLQAASEIAERGTFTGLARAIPFEDQSASLGAAKSRTPCMTWRRLGNTMPTEKASAASRSG